MFGSLNDRPKKKAEKKMTLKTDVPFETALDLMLSLGRTVEAERLDLTGLPGRILAEDVRAIIDIPPFDNSPYDGYAFRAADSANASEDTPVTLRVVEEIPAGSISERRLEPGTAAKILTGAPLPEGADTVVKFEAANFTAEAVTIFSRFRPGQDVIATGEDVRAGVPLGWKGEIVDPALAGSLAAQGLTSLMVYRKPRVGIISTGSELVEPGQPISGGTIRNSNRYVLEAAVAMAGAEPVFLGSARDEADSIAALISRGLAECDLIISTGGVSVGDYDLTPEALEMAGATVMVRGVRLKPGGACAYGEKGGRLVFCLSGRPASALVNFYAVVLPCLRRLCGHRNHRPPMLKVELVDGFPKKSPETRIIRGRLDFSSGRVRMRVPSEQGNCVLHSLIGCDVMAVIPAGSPPLTAGTTLDGYLIR